VHSGNQGGRPHGHIIENPALTHVRLSHRTKHLLYHMKPRDETVDSFVYRLLVANGGNLALSGYQPDGLFFKRHRHNSDQLVGSVAAALDKRINNNAPNSSKTTPANNHRQSWKRRKRF